MFGVIKLMFRVSEPVFGVSELVFRLSQSVFGEINYSQQRIAQQLPYRVKS